MDTAQHGQIGQLRLAAALPRHDVVALAPRHRPVAPGMRTAAIPGGHGTAQPVRNRPGRPADIQRLTRAVQDDRHDRRVAAQHPQRLRRQRSRRSRGRRRAPGSPGPPAGPARSRAAGARRTPGPSTGRGRARTRTRRPGPRPAAARPGGRRRRSAASPSRRSRWRSRRTSRRRRTGPSAGRHRMRSRVRNSSLTCADGRSSGSAPSWSSASTSAAPQACSSEGCSRPVLSANADSAPAHCSGVSRRAEGVSSTRAITSTCRRLARPSANTAAVAGSRAGSAEPSSPTRGETRSAATTRRRASNRSQPSRSARAAADDLYPFSANTPRRSSAATAETAVRSSLRAAFSHRVRSATRSASVPVPAIASSASNACVSRRSSVAIVVSGTGTSSRDPPTIPATRFAIANPPFPNSQQGGGSPYSNPSSRARATASARDDTPSLRNSRRPCVLTVFSDRCRTVPISRCDSVPASSGSSSRSRSLRTISAAALGVGAAADAGRRSDADPGEPDRERSGVRAGPRDAPCLVEQPPAVVLVGRGPGAHGEGQRELQQTRAAPGERQRAGRRLGGTLGPARGGEQRGAGEMRQSGHEVLGDAGVGVTARGRAARGGRRRPDPPTSAAASAR